MSTIARSQTLAAQAENVRAKSLVQSTLPSNMAAPARQFGNNVTNTVQVQGNNNGMKKGKSVAVPQLVAVVNGSTGILRGPAAFTTTQSVQVKQAPRAPSATLFTAANNATLPLSSAVLDGVDAMLVDDADDAMRIDGATPRRPAASQPRMAALVRMPSELTFGGPAGNAQYVEDWISEIVPNMKLQERMRVVAADYMSRQTDINSRMREILVDWLIEVHLKFKLQPETLYLTINLVDRFLESKVINRTKLQLIGCTAMLLASKYEEIYAPEIADFVAISDRAYSREQILAMECVMLGQLNFNITHTSPLRFAERLCRVATLHQFNGETTEQIEWCTKYLIELTLQHYALHLNYLPSHMAAAALCVALATCVNTQHPSTLWSDALVAESGYSLAQLKQCIVELYDVASVDTNKYRAARKKYSHRKFGEVSKLQLRNPFVQY